MPTLKIDGQVVEAPEGATILAAAEKLGVHIPTLCHVPGAKPLESCFVCAVHVVGHNKLVPACSMPVHEGMEVVTDSPQVLEARRTAVELLLSDHLGECLAPCQLACPATWDIPAFMEALTAGDTAAAAATARIGLVLPAVLGHICTAPCRKACRRNDRDNTVAIRDLHRWTGELVSPEGAEASSRGRKPPESGAPTEPSPGGAKDKHVAIIGAGPAGLAAAYALVLAGHTAVVFDGDDAPGGSLRKMDPAELPPAALAADLAAIEAAGVEFRMNTRVGRDIDMAQVKSEFDAVVFAIGANPPADLAGGDVGFEPTAPPAGQPGIFTAGAYRGRSGPAVRVVADGLTAAAAVGRYLAGGDAAEPPRPVNIRYGPLTDEEQDVLWSRPTNNAPEPGEVADAASAGAEARRCLICGCVDNHLCKLRRVATELGARANRHVGERRRLARDDSHPQVTYEPHKCILCGACVVRADASDDASLTYVGRGFSSRISGPYEGPMADALGADGAGFADLCPTSAFARKRTKGTAE